MLTDAQKILIDFALGDGYIGGSDTKGYFLQIQHSTKQREYLLHKVSVLQEYGYNPSFTEEYRENSYGKHFVRSVTYTKHAKTAKKYMYNKGRKQIDKHLLSVCDRKSLAYWFMDDGCVDYNDKLRTDNILYTYEIPSARSYRIATNSFSYDNVVLVVDWLRERFNIHAKINLQKQKPYISISTIQSKDIFRHIIEDYIIPSMQYKIQYPHSLKGIPYVSTVRD